MSVQYCVNVEIPDANGCFFFTKSGKVDWALKRRGLCVAHGLLPLRCIALLRWYIEGANTPKREKY